MCSTTTSSSNSNSSIQRAMLGMLYSLLLRSLSFVLTILTKRFVSAETLGKADVTLDLLMSSCLMIGREGFRLALGRGSEQEDSTKQSSKDTGAADNISKEECPSDANDKKTQAETSTAKNEQEIQDQRIANTSYLSIPFGIVCSLIGLAIHLYHTTEGGMDAIFTIHTLDPPHKDYLLGGILYLSASLLESLSEPFQLQCLRTMDVDSRAAAEGCGSLGRAIMNVLLLGGLVDRLLLLKVDAPIGLAENYPVSCFGMGHVTHAVLLGLVMRWRKRGAMRIVIRRTEPKQQKQQGSSAANRESTANNTDTTTNTESSQGVKEGLLSNFDVPALRLTTIFTIQSVFKQIITEGDRIVLTLLGNDEERGVYGLASSIGGIASRMLLQPVEENARLLFGRLGADVPKTTNATTQQSKLDILQRTYTTLIKLILYVGLVFASLGSNYTSILLRILVGNQWASNPDATAALSAFCVYTALLALNGTTEAFVYGTASSYADVGVLSTVHAGVTVVAFGGAAPLLVNWYGTVGLVGANCLAMALRSVYSIHFAATYLCRAAHGVNNPQQSSIAQKMYQLVFRGILPKTPVLVLFTATYVITSRTRLQLLEYEHQLVAEGQTVSITSKGWLLAAGRHIGVGVGCLLCIAMAAYRLETDLKRDVKSIRTGKVD